MSQSLNIIIVEKIGTLKSLSIKEFKEEELYKKCGFKKGDDFIKQVEWTAKYDGKKYIIHVYANSLLNLCSWMLALNLNDIILAVHHRDHGRKILELEWDEIPAWIYNMMSSVDFISCLQWLYL